MPLNNLQHRICISADIDPNLIDLIDDDKIYSIRDLADLYKCDYKTMTSVIDDVPIITLDRKRGKRVMGRTLKSAIIERIRCGKNPFNQTSNILSLS
jgi:hypothetical protein